MALAYCGHSGMPVHAVRWSPDGMRVASASRRQGEGGYSAFLYMEERIEWWLRAADRPKSTKEGWREGVGRLLGEGNQGVGEARERCFVPPQLIQVLYEPVWDKRECVVTANTPLHADDLSERVAWNGKDATSPRFRHWRDFDQAAGRHGRNISFGVATARWLTG